MLTTRGQFTDTYLETMLPALRAVTMRTFKEHPEQYSQIFNVDDSGRSIEQFTEVTGFATLHEINEGEPAPFDQPMQAFNKTYRHRKFGLGYQVTQEAVDDDKHRIIKGLAEELGISARETVEIEAALIFNRGFSGSYLGPDGVALFSTAHPNVGGGTQANKPSVDLDLSQSAIEAGLTTFRGWTDHRGKKKRIIPTKLVIPPALEFVASEILGSSLRSNTANNAVNPLQHRKGLRSFEDCMVWEYLTDPNAWFICGEKSRLGLRFFWRKQFKTMSEYNLRTDAVETIGRMRFSTSWDQWLGLYGSSGSS